MSKQKEELYRMIDALSEKKIVVAKRLLEKLLRKQALESYKSINYESYSVQKKITKGKDLLKFIGTIDKSELETMELAINKGCEKIDYAEW